MEGAAGERKEEAVSWGQSVGKASLMMSAGIWEMPVLVGRRGQETKKRLILGRGLDDSES